MSVTTQTTNPFQLTVHASGFRLPDITTHQSEQAARDYLSRCTNVDSASLNNEGAPVCSWEKTGMVRHPLSGDWVRGGALVERA